MSEKLSSFEGPDISEKDMSRRDFLKITAGAFSGAVLSGVGIEVEAATFEELRQKLITDFEEGRMTKEKVKWVEEKIRLIEELKKIEAEAPPAKEQTDLAIKKYELTSRQMRIIRLIRSGKIKISSGYYTLFDIMKEEKFPLPVIESFCNEIAPKEKGVTQAYFDDENFLNQVKSLIRQWYLNKSKTEK